MHPKEDEEIIRGHSTSAGGMNRPSITAQLLAGKNLMGDEPENRHLIDDGEFKIGILYYDKREEYDVMPVEIYGDKIRILDGRSCHIDYARQNWEKVI